MRFRLEVDHYGFVGADGIGRYVRAGEEIGDGTMFPFSGKPSMFMVPLDDEAMAVKAEYDKERAAKAEAAFIAGRAMAAVKSVIANTEEPVKLT
jgi:hypothetical protein